MNEEQVFFRETLKNAVKDVYNENRFILNYKTQELKGLEQSFAFRVGINLYKALQNTVYSALDLDAEYNKSIGASKMLEEFNKGIRPDLVLHERGTHDNNKLAIEFKGYWTKNNLKDIRKLIGLTSPGGEYNYSLGILVQIGRTEATFIYFINGVKI